MAHPKISDFLKAVIEAEKRKIDTIQSKQFLFFVHRNHIGLGNDPDYVLYIQDHQRLALNELVAAGILKENEAEKLLLTSEDFVPWERDY